MIRFVLLFTTLVSLGACANPGPDANVGFSFQVGGGPTATRWEWGNPDAYQEARARLEKLVADARERERLQIAEAERGFIYLDPGERYILYRPSFTLVRDGGNVRCRDGRRLFYFEDFDRKEVGLRCPV